MSDAERKTASRNAALASGASRRAQQEPKRGQGFIPHIDGLDVLKACAPALTAMLDTGEVDHSARLGAAHTLLSFFPAHYRSSPEQVRELLASILPASVLPHQADASNVYIAARREWDRLRIRAVTNGDANAGQIITLYAKPYPPDLIAPWEDRDAVLRSQPKPEGRLERTVDGRVILHRDGQMPLLLES